MLEQVKKIHIIPENYYGTATPNEFIYFSKFVGCMGICLVDSYGFKSFVHLADLYGFPIKRLAKNAHPLPREYWQKNTIFSFLKSKLKGHKLERVIVFGNYRNHPGIFNLSRGAYVDSDIISAYIAKNLGISPSQLSCIYFKNSESKITKNNTLEIIDDELTALEKIQSDNMSFYNSFSRTTSCR